MSRRRVCPALAVPLAVLALAAPARADDWTALVVNDLSTSSSVTPVDTATDAAGAAVGVGSTPLGIAIAPDASRAYVVNAAASSVTPIDLTTPVPSAQPAVTIPGSGRGLNFVAISPSGAKAYVSDPANGQVIPLDLTTSPPTPGTPIAAGTHPEGIAFTPDGTTAWVADNGGGALIPINAATDATGTPLPVGSEPFGIAITPDGTRAYVTDSAAGKVYPVGLAGRTVETAITVGTDPRGVAITPDGAHAYVANYGATTVTPITTATNTAGAAITTGPGPFALAVTPDGRKLYVANGNGSTVVPVDLTQSPPAPGSAITVGDDPRGVAITPDQAPNAVFNADVGAPGATTTFDASGSTARFGTIASYAWDFGDGTQLTTAAPTVTHVYAAGTYTATLTVTDGAGTSLTSIFTGQTFSRHGGAAARTTRSLTVAAGAPAVAVAPGLLAFGAQRVGTTSAAQTATVTNTGSAALHVGPIPIFGPNTSGEFKKTADTCENATIAPGAHCTIAVAFAPTADGGAGGGVIINDDASGSPHVVSLSGTGFSTGTLTGHVLDGTSSARPGVAGALVVACPPGQISSSECISATTDSQGAYTIAGLAPGERGVEVFAPGEGKPGAKLWGASENLQIAVGPQSHDFVLDGPQPLPAGMSVDTGTGTTGAGGGTPVLYPNQPFALNVPVDIDQEGPPNEAVVEEYVGGLTSDGGAGAGAGQVLAGALLMFAVKYDANGDAAGISQIVTGAIDPSATATMSCKDNPLLDNNILRISPDGTGGIIVNTPGIATGEDFSGDQHVPSLHLTPIDIGPLLDGLGPTIPINANDFLPGQAATYNTVVGALEGGYYSLRNGTNPLPQIIMKIAGDKLSGAFHGPAKMAYKATSSALKKAGIGGPGGGGGPVNTCPKPPPKPKRRPQKPPPKPKPSSQSGSTYVDPSGLVETTAHVPVAGARVVLERATSAKAKPAAVPGGSAVMSSANRTNPDTTSALGRFGWDTIPGFYAVSASKAGCTKPHSHGTTVSTRTFAVPPPRDNLALVLSCPHLARAKTTTRLTTVRGAKSHGRRLYTMTATITGHGGKPVGVVAFRAGSKLLFRMPLDRKRQAVFQVALSGTPRLRASYEGDGRFAPSHS